MRRILIIALLIAIPVMVATVQKNYRDSFIPADSYTYNGIESAAGTCHTATSMSC